MLFISPVVTVELERRSISVNESDESFVACVTKDLETVRPVVLQIGDTPVTAGQIEHW